MQTPIDTDGEATVLSECIGDESGLTVAEVRAILVHSDFYARDNGRIFEAICEIVDAGLPLDMAAVARRLKEKFDKGGGESGSHIVHYLLNNVVYAPSGSATAHARVVREKSRLRQAIHTFRDLSVQAQTDLGPDGTQQFLEEAETRISEIAHAASDKNLVSMGPVMRGALDHASQAAKGEVPQGAPTGFDTDRVTGGLHEGSLRLVAARPGMGKSAFVLCELIQQAKKGFAGALFSLEMTMLEVGFRAASIESGIEARRLKEGKLTKEEWGEFTKAADRLGQLPIWIDDTSNLSVHQLRARVRRLQMEVRAGKYPSVTQGRLGGVVVDYLQLVTSPLSGDRFANRENQVSAISREFKRMAMELSIPLTAVAQLNRDLEKRGDKHPILSDLRESGSLEQDADTVLFIYRDDYYHPDGPDKNLADVDIAKQRTGGTSRTKLKWTGECTRFSNLVGVEYDFLDNFSEPG